MSKVKEFIAYGGDAFTIEWYFDEYDHSEALEYYNQLNTYDRIQVLKLFKRMSNAGEIHDKTKFRFEGDKIYAFKPQPERFLCFFYESKKIIVTNGFRKKQQKLPALEKENALKKRDSYIWTLAIFKPNLHRDPFALRRREIDLYHLSTER